MQTSPRRVARGGRERQELGTAAMEAMETKDTAALNQADLCSLGLFRVRIQEEWVPISEVEVIQAIKALALGRSAGPEGLPAILYKRAPALSRVLV